jgi:hypothetical protein
MFTGAWLGGSGDAAPTVNNYARLIPRSCMPVWSDPEVYWNRLVMDKFVAVTVSSTCTVEWIDMTSF